MTLLEELGIDPSAFIWEDLALCNGMDTNLFFDDYEADKQTAIQIDNCCLSCPVFKECAAVGAEGNYGVFGSVYWNGSGKPDVNRNLHKTPEVWQRIRERLSEE